MRGFKMTLFRDLKDAIEESWNDLTAAQRYLVVAVWAAAIGAALGHL